MLITDTHRIKFLKFNDIIKKNQKLNRHNYQNLETKFIIQPKKSWKHLKYARTIKKVISKGKGTITTTLPHPYN